jgi:ABC-type branched-subunit amino acid transport system substrate-binding protein
MKRLSCLLVALAVGCSPSSKSEPIWVGHLAPLSGPERERGEESVAVMQRVLEESGEEATVQKRPVGIRHVDSTSDNARAEATRLLAVNGCVALIVGPGASNVEELIAAARSFTAPVIVLDEVVDPPTYAGLVLLGPDPVRRGEEAAAQLSRREVKQVALITESGPTYRAVAESFAKHFKGELRRWDVADLKRVGEAGFSPFAVMKGQKPAAVVVAAPAEWCLESRKALREALPDADLYFVGDDGAALRDKLANREFAITIVPPADAELPQAGAALRRQGKQLSRDALLASDAVRMVLQGLRKTRTLQRDKLVDALETIGEFDSSTGEVTWKQGRPARRLFVVAGKADR